jgi:hypothetical protein
MIGLNIYLTLALALVPLHRISVSTVPEQAEEKPKLYFPFFGKDMGCENNRFKFEYLRNYASHEAKHGRVIILISRMGRDETLQRLQDRRLYNLRKAMEGYPQVIITSGEKVSPHGKVDVYIAGKLEDEILIEKNKDLCMTCCEGDSVYYPDIDRRKRQPN